MTSCLFEAIGRTSLIGKAGLPGRMAILAERIPLGVSFGIDWTKMCDVRCVNVRSDHEHLGRLASFGKLHVRKILQIL